MKDPMIELLKESVCNQFERNITSSSDCMALSESIFAKTYFYLSPNTLRRFFGLVKSNFKQSSSTLRILSVYCGCRDFPDFKDRNFQPKEKDSDVVKNQHFEYILKTVPTLKYHDRSFREVVKHTYFLLAEQPDLRSEYLRDLAGTQNGRLFFEKFIDIDNLNGYYGEGIQYYLSECIDNREMSFGNFILSLKYWLINDDENLSIVVNLLEQIASPESPEINTRQYLYARLLLESHLKLDKSKSLSEIVRMHISSLKSMHHESYTNFNFKTISFLILILTKNYQEALICINETNKYAGVIPDYNTYSESINLYNAIALFYVGDKPKAKELFYRIDTSDFYFLVKSMNMILYKNLEAALLEKPSQPQLELLLNKTGFIKLNKIIPPLYITN